MCKKFRKERIELVEYLMAKKADSDQLPLLTQVIFVLNSSGFRRTIIPFLIFEIYFMFSDKIKSNG